MTTYYFSQFSESGTAAGLSWAVLTGIGWSPLCTAVSCSGLSWEVQESFLGTSDASVSLRLPPCPRPCSTRVPAGEALAHSCRPAELPSAGTYFRSTPFSCSGQVSHPWFMRKGKRFYLWMDGAVCMRSWWQPSLGPNTSKKPLLIFWYVFPPIFFFMQRFCSFGRVYFT